MSFKDLSVNKITNAVEKYAEVGGFAAGFLAYGVDKTMSDIQRLLSGRIHAPDLAPMIKDLFAATGGGERTSATTKLSIMGYIIGEILDESGVKQGTLLKKVSKGVFIGNLAQHLLFWTTNSSPAEAAARGSGSGNSSPIGNRGYGY